MGIDEVMSATPGVMMMAGVAAANLGPSMLIEGQQRPDIKPLPLPELAFRLIPSCLFSCVTFSRCQLLLFFCKLDPKVDLTLYVLLTLALSLATSLTLARPSCWTRSIRRDDEQRT